MKLSSLKSPILIITEIQTTKRDKSLDQAYSAKSGPKTKSERLHALLAPLPRHMVGPVPTFSSGQEEAVSQATPVEFSCPSNRIERSSRGRSWRAFPDPNSCRWNN